MFESVHVVGSGRAGGAIAGRLRERNMAVTVGREPDPEAELVLLAVPDAAITEVAARVPIGPWIAHVSGATRLAALEPHPPERRFSLHPLQTLSRERAPEQLDAAWAALSAETAGGLDRAAWLAEALGLRPFVISDDDRPLYHAGAVIAGNFLVTLYRTASRLMGVVGAPPEALVPLMLRTIENGFVLTGPIERGDEATVAAHLRALEDHAPDLVPLYRALAEATRR
jgi:predicted short-subunit dehydrogenase-like oxidoreductase (DUF2520 family)